MNTLINVKLLCEHLYCINNYHNINNNSDSDFIEKLKTYLIALINITDLTDTYKQKITNSTSIINSINDILIVYNDEPIVEWYRILWKIIFQMPAILNYNKDKYKNDIITIINLLPYVGITCKNVCSSHMIDYLTNNETKIENNIGSPEMLYDWIVKFKENTKKSSE